MIEFDISFLHSPIFMGIAPLDQSKSFTKHFIIS